MSRQFLPTGGCVRVMMAWGGGGPVFDGNEFSVVLAAYMACGWLQQWVLSKELLYVIPVVNLILDDEVNVVLLVAGLLPGLAVVTLSGVDEIKNCIVFGHGVERLEGNGESTIEGDVVLGHRVFSKCANLRQGSVDRRD